MTKNKPPLSTCQGDAAWVSRNASTLESQTSRDSKDSTDCRLATLFEITLAPPTTEMCLRCLLFFADENDLRPLSSSFLASRFRLPCLVACRRAGSTLRSCGGCIQRIPWPAAHFDFQNKGSCFENSEDLSSRQ